MSHDTGYATLSSPLARSLAPELITLVAAFGLSWLLARGLRTWVRPGNRRFGEAGTITIQFLLLAPLFLGNLLITLQIALIAQAKLVVNYAAFTAARSAVVVVPASIRSRKTGQVEVANQFSPGNLNSLKMRLIRRAAALACVGVSPPWTPTISTNVGMIPGLEGVPALGAIASLFPADGLPVAEQFVSRSIYAMHPDNTKVTVKRESHAKNAGGSYSLITVRVTYRYYLTVPFANRLFGQRFNGAGWFGEPAYYATIVDEYTLSSEDDFVLPDHRLIEPEDVEIGT